MKKIIISVTNDLVSDQRVHKVASSLFKFGYDITLVGRKLPESKPVLKRDYHTHRFKLLFRKGIIFYAEYNLRLFLYLLFTNHDISLSNDLDTLPANYVASKLKRTKLVYDSHEYFTEVPELVARRLKKKIWEFIESLILPRIKNSYTVCKSIADIYNVKYGINMQVIRNLPVCNYNNGNKSNPTQSEEKNIILYQGAINLGRGIDTVISSMKYLNDCVFWIAGTGDEYDKIKEHAKTEGVESKVKFLGKIPFEELHSYTSQASLGISLEENMGLNYYYSLPNKIFDYIQAGVPILVSPFPEMQNIIDKYKVGMIAENREPEKLASQIKFMLTNDKARKEWGEKLKIASKELCWENEETILHSIFKSVSIQQTGLKNSV